MPTLPPAVGGSSAVPVIPDLAGGCLVQSPNHNQALRGGRLTVIVKLYVASRNHLVIGPVSS